MSNMQVLHILLCGFVTALPLLLAMSKLWNSFLTAILSPFVVLGCSALVCDLIIYVR